MNITLQRLAEVLTYHPTTGEFVWRKTFKCTVAGEPAGSICERGYLRISIDGKRYKAHRLAWMFVHRTLPVQHIDHKDCNRANNAIDNLRLIDRKGNAENQRAAHSNNQTGFLGVRKRANGRFQAQIQVDGRNRSIATFDTPEDAHAAYVAEKRLVHASGTL